MFEAVIQRVKSASVTVDGQLISSISKGLLVFAAVGKDDTPKEAENMASKLLKVKFWEDESGGKWKKNVQDIDGEVLCGKRPFCAILSSSIDSHPDVVLPSLPVHAPCIHEKGEQTGLSQISAPRQR